MVLLYSEFLTLLRISDFTDNFCRCRLLSSYGVTLLRISDFTQNFWLYWQFLQVPPSLEPWSDFTEAATGDKFWCVPWLICTLFHTAYLCVVSHNSFTYFTKSFTCVWNCWRCIMWLRHCSMWLICPTLLPVTHLHSSHKSFTYV